MSREDWLDCPDPEGDRIEAQERRDRESEKAPDYGYRCHSCRRLVDVEDVQRHIAAHKADPVWDGVLFLEREDHAPR